MGAISKILRSTQDNGLMFWCPGCGYLHCIHHGPGAGPRWTWNGSPDRPTFTPSILVRTGRAVDPSFVPEPGDFPEICHSFVTDGQIQFLSDCKHALAGQTVPMSERWVVGE